MTEKRYHRFRIVSLALVAVIVTTLLGVGIFTYPRETFTGVVAGVLILASIAAIFFLPFPDKGE